MKIPPVVARLWADAHRRKMSLERYLLEVLEVAASQLPVQPDPAGPMTAAEVEQWRQVYAFFTGAGGSRLRELRRFVAELAATPCLCVRKDIVCWACRARRLLRGRRNEAEGPDQV